MKKQLPVGLVVEGNATGSAVLRLPALAQELGALKSTSLQVARRISNFLRAGYAITHYEDLQESKLILIRVPDASAPRVVDELCQSELMLEGRHFILCESWLLAEVLAPLKRRGAQVATFVAAPSSGVPCFIVEGDIPAVRQARRLLERCDARTVELATGAKPLYFAADLLIRALPVPLLLMSQQALRAGGVSGNHLTMLIEELSRELVTKFLKGGRANWGGPLTECSTATAQAHLSQLSKLDPDLATVVTDLLAWAQKRLTKRARGHSA